MVDSPLPATALRSRQRVRSPASRGTPAGSSYCTRLPRGCRHILQSQLHLDKARAGVESPWYLGVSTYAAAVEGFACGGRESQSTYKGVRGMTFAAFTPHFLLWNHEFLARLDLIWIAENITIRFEDLHVLAGIAVELTANRRERVPCLHGVTALILAAAD